MYVYSHCLGVQFYDWAFDNINDSVKRSVYRLRTFGLKLKIAILALYKTAD